MYKSIFIIIPFCILLITCTKNTQNSDNEDKEFVFECGMYVSEDVTLTEDMTCPFDGPAPITITGSNLTLDLGGHTLKNNNYFGNIGIIVHNGVSNVTIKNGTIEDFETGIDIRNSRNIIVEDIIFANLKHAHPDTFIFGVVVAESDSVFINRCSGAFLPQFHRETVGTSSSSVFVDSLFQTGGGLAVSFSFGGGCINGDNSGSITNSRVENCKGGILLQCSNGVVIKNNEFVNCDAAITVYGPTPNSNKNVLIEENYSHSNTATGVDFFGAKESIIRNNIFIDGWYGIKLDKNHESFNSPTDFYSTDNLIIDNVVTGNDTDLYHHPMSIGNTWLNNTCGTKKGSEIPECTG